MNISVTVKVFSFFFKTSSDLLFLLFVLEKSNRLGSLSAHIYLFQTLLVNVGMNVSHLALRAANMSNCSC